VPVMVAVTVVVPIAGVSWLVVRFTVVPPAELPELFHVTRSVDQR
jgi:hypothetical protein